MAMAMVPPTGPAGAAPAAAKSNLARACALEAARAAALAAHAAAGLAMVSDRKAARALRAAEACCRTSVALLLALPAPAAVAPPSGAAATAPPRRRRRRGKRGGRKRGADEAKEKAGEGFADAAAQALPERAAARAPAASAPVPMVGVEEEGAARHGRKRGALGTSQAAAERVEGEAEEEDGEAKFRATLMRLVQDPAFQAGRPQGEVLRDAFANAFGEQGMAVPEDAALARAFGFGLPAD